MLAQIQRQYNDNKKSLSISLEFLLDFTENIRNGFLRRWVCSIGCLDAMGIWRVQFMERSKSRRMSTNFIIFFFFWFVCVNSFTHFWSRLKFFGKIKQISQRREYKWWIRLRWPFVLNGIQKCSYFNYLDRIFKCIWTLDSNAHMGWQMLRFHKSKNYKYDIKKNHDLRMQIKADDNIDVCKYPHVLFHYSQRFEWTSEKILHTKSHQWKTNGRSEKKKQYKYKH